MNIGIDATNISRGGGITHLVELLKVADPDVHNFSHIYIWSSSSTLETINDKPWITKIHSTLLDKSLPFRVFYQNHLLSDEARKLNCSILFVPGGTFLGDFRPFVVMCQNMLPFETKEMKRYGLSLTFLKFILLRAT
ncbi:MAG TPA: hypothetical protein VFD91_08960 [Mariniphaga sp.]|nr:hypothetical protein [Mariniphaga sp.]